MAISDYISTAITDFVDYAMIIVVVLIIYYVIKFFMTEPPTKAEREEAERKRLESGAEARKWVKKRMKKSKEKREGAKTKKEKKDRLSPTKKVITSIFNSCQRIEDLLNNKKKEKAIKEIKSLNKNFKEIRNNLEALFEHYDRSDPVLQVVVNGIRAAKELYLTRIKNDITNIPDVTDATWDTKRDEIKNNLESVVSHLETAFNKLSEFHG